MKIIVQVLVILFVTLVQASKAQDMAHHAPNSDAHPCGLSLEGTTNLTWDMFRGNVAFSCDTARFLDMNIHLGLSASFSQQANADELETEGERLPIDREEYSGELVLYAQSFPVPYNQLLSYRIILGIGGSYLKWNGTHPHLTIHLGGEVAYLIPGYDLGPFMGVDSELGQGIDIQHLSGRVLMGIRYVSSYPDPAVPEARAYGFYGGSTERTEDDWRLERNSVQAGVGIMVSFFNVFLKIEGGVTLRSWGEDGDPYGTSTRKSEEKQGFGVISAGIEF